MNDTALAVNFHGQDLFIVEHNGQPYTPMKTIVENMGLDWKTQHRKLSANPQRWGMVIMTIPTLGDMQEALCMPLRKLFGWLSTISPNKVKPELREKIIFYQNECDDVLWEHWTKNQPKRNGLVELPTSPFVTSKEKLLLRTAIENQCAKTKEAHAYYWRRLHNAYHVSTLEDLPTGKVDEMLAFLGLREPTLDEYVVVKQERLLALEQKAAALPEPVVQKFEPIAAGCVVISIEMFKKYEKLQEKLNSIWFTIDR